MHQVLVAHFCHILVTSDVYTRRQKDGSFYSKSVVLDMTWERGRCLKVNFMFPERLLPRALFPY